MAIFRRVRYSSCCFRQEHPLSHEFLQRKHWAWISQNSSLRICQVSSLTLLTPLIKCCVCCVIFITLVACDMLLTLAYLLCFPWSCSNPLTLHANIHELFHLVVNLFAINASAQNWSQPDPPENCHLNVKKIAKNLTFFFLITQNFH